MGKLNTWPVKFGFISDPRECVNKEIEAVEVVSMGYGCTWKSAVVMKFTDGARAFFAGQAGTGIVSPPLESVEKSRIFTADEYAEYAKHERLKKERREKEKLEEKKRRIEQLKREIGED